MLGSTRETPWRTATSLRHSHVSCHWVCTTSCTAPGLYDKKSRWLLWLLIVTRTSARFRRSAVEEERPTVGLRRRSASSQRPTRTPVDVFLGRRTTPTTPPPWPRSERPRTGSVPRAGTSTSRPDARCPEVGTTGRKSFRCRCSRRRRRRRSDVMPLPWRHRDAAPAGRPHALMTSSEMSQHARRRRDNTATRDVDVESSQVYKHHPQQQNLANESNWSRQRRRLAVASV